MDTAISLLMIFLVSWAVGHVFWSWLERKTYEEYIKGTVEQVVEKNFILMRIEHDDEHGYFAYRAESEEFLAHGSTFDQLQQNFASRFPNKTGLISDAGTKVLRITA